MQVIGEVDWRCPSGQLNDASLRRQHINALIRLVQGRTQDVLTRGLTGLFGSLDVGVPGQQLAHPRQLAIVVTGGSHLAAARACFFVAPVRRHAILGELMHFVGTDLYFERPSLLIRHHRMQRAVAIGFGTRNIVVELILQRHPQLMHERQRCVAIPHIVDNDTQGPQVIHLGEIQPF